MAFTEQQVAALSADLDKRAVRSRDQGRGKVSYIEGWHAIAEANRIFGFGEWDRETVEIRQTCEPYQRPVFDRQGNPVKDRNTGENAMNWSAGYMARVRVTVRAGGVVVVREGCGFGSGIDRDLGMAHESALKEAETDAMKRAFMTFGNPFGLALYDKTQAHVSDTEKPADKPVEQPKTPLMPHKIPVPKFGPNASADEKTHGWRNWLTAMRDAIDNAPTLDELNKWISLNNDGLDGLRDFNPDGEDFLLKRADNKRGVFAQAPKKDAA